MKTCKRCTTEKPLNFFPPMSIRKDGRGNVCIQCVLKPKRSLSTNAHVTQTKEKRKAFLRDGGCVVDGCVVRDYYSLDFHHAYSKAKDKFYDKNVNDYRRGVMLCRTHHEQAKYNNDLYRYCQSYLENIHGDYLYSIITERNERNKFETKI